DAHTTSSSAVMIIKIIVIALENRDTCARGGSCTRPWCASYA
ncbi:hypothetical protein ALC60_08865, partial [Trachymyrmex zeteki]